MAIASKFSTEDMTLVVSIDGDFNFTLLNEFRQAYSHVVKKTGAVKYIVDMKNTSTIDSSALGMLLNMQRDLNKQDGEIRITNCNKDVKKIFQITRFNKKFTIE